MPRIRSPIVSCEIDMPVPLYFVTMVDAQRKRKLICDLKDGEQVDSLFSVKQKRPPRSYARGYWFELRVGDRTGEMTLKFWGTDNEEEVRRLYDSFKVGQVISVRGFASRYRDAMEITVNPDTGSIALVEEGDFDVRDFVQEGRFTQKDLAAKLMRFVEAVQDQRLRALLEHFFHDKKLMDRFTKAPGSMWLHCNWLGGLAEHTLNVASICKYLAGKYKGKLNRDLLLTGALLHDIGKVEEYKVTTNIDVTKEGMLRGHIVIGAEMVSKAADELMLPEDLKLKVVHMVLASHGMPEYGSPKKPQFPEALALNFADDLDAKLEQMIKLRDEANTEDPWIYDKRFGPVFLH